jgi:anti-sigma B factor antagonist
MRLKESLEEGIALLSLEGEIDLHYAPVLRALLQGKARERCPALIVDLARVSFVDSAGLAAIIEYFRDSGEYGGLICLTGLNENLHAVFEIVRLDQVLPIFVSSAEAIAALKNGSVEPPAAALFGRSAA